MQTFLGLLSLYFLICVFFPIKPVRTRGQAVLLLIFSLFVTGMIKNTETSTYAGTTSSNISSPPTPKTWEYNSSVDEMRNKETKTACIEANELLYFDFPYNGGVSANLCLRKSPKFGNDVYLSVTKGQFLCSFNGCSVTVKFDDGEIQKFSAVEPSDNSSEVIFIQNYKRFSSQIKKANQVIIESEFYHEGIKQMKFNTAGLNWE